MSLLAMSRLTSSPPFPFSYTPMLLLASPSPEDASILTYVLFSTTELTGKSSTHTWEATTSPQSTLLNPTLPTSTHPAYDADEQEYILWQVQAAWFMAMVTGQACHIWFVRTSTASIFANGFFPQSFFDWLDSLRGVKPLATKEPKDEEVGNVDDTKGGVGSHKDEPIAVFSNYNTNVGVCCAIAVGCFVIYCHGVIEIVQARSISSYSCR